MFVRSRSSFVDLLLHAARRPLGAVIALALSVLLTGLAGPQSVHAQSYSQTATLSSAGANPNLTWGDHDGDGNFDLVVLGQGGSTIYTADGSGGFSSTFSFNGFDNGAADWGDFDGDGDLDLVVTGFEAGQNPAPATRIYENTGGGNFSVVGAGIVGLSDGSASWGDYDKDGDPDLLVSGIDDIGANITRVYRNDGGGTFVQALDGGEQGGPSAWGDFDGDGDLDFIVTGFYSSLSVVWENRGDTDDDGDIEFGRVSNSIPGVQDGTVDWGDADADGAAELAILGDDGSQSLLRVFDYDNGGFVEEDAVVGSERGSVDWGDADSDGALDLLVTGYNGETRTSAVYTNDGDGTSFSFADDSFPDVRDGRAAFGDYDDDGTLDVAVTGNASSGNIVEVWSGSAPRTNRSPQTPSGLEGTVDGLANTLTLNWQGTSDRSPDGTGGQPTPASGLTYNLFVRPQGSGDFLYPPEASTSSGQRWVVRRGNVGAQTSFALDPDALSEGTYEWSVQALDFNYAGSSFPSTNTFTIARSDLALSANVGDATIPQDRQTTVTLTLSNTGSSDTAGESEVSVSLPSGLSVQGSSGDGSYDMGTDTWTVAQTIASGGSASIDLTVRLDAPSQQTLSAELTATETIDTDGSNHTVQAAIGPAEVDLALSATGTEVVQGGQETSTFTLQHTSGTHDATNVTVDVAVPTGLSVQGSSGDGTYSGGTWNVGTVGTGATATLDLTVQKTAAPPQTLSGQLGSSGINDPNGADATAVAAPPPYGSGQALTFDGSGDHVATGAGGDDLGLVGESFSVDVWFKPNHLQDDRTLLGMDGGSANQTLHLVLKGDGAVRFGFFGNDLDAPSGTVTTGSWQHLTFVYDASTGDRFIYRNGEQVATDNTSSDFQGTADLLIGRYASGNYFDGQIDQVRVWQGALSQQQVQARMNRTIDLASDVGGELVAAYRFDTGSGTTAYDVASGHDGTLQGDPQWTDPSETPAGRESAVLTDSNTPVTVGPSGSRVEAALSSGTGLANAATVYRWGTEGGSVVTDETFPNGVDDRSNVAWGVWPRGSAETELTLRYGDVSGLPSGEFVRLLKRDRPGTAWTNVSGAGNVSHDTGNDQFTVTGVSDPAQYAVTTIPEVDLQLSDLPTKEIAQGEQTTLTLTLEHTSGSADATNVTVEVTVPSGLSVQGSSGDGSYSGGTWDVATVGAGATATLDLTVQKTAAAPQTLSAQLSALAQIDPDGANASGIVAPRPYGSRQALALDGNGDYVNAGSGIRLDNRSFTISFWARRTASGSDHIVIGQGPDEAYKRLFVGFLSSDKFLFGFTNTILTTSATYTGGGWHHWAVTYDASNRARRIYRDGVQVASDFADAAFQGTGDFFIGQSLHNGGSDRFPGQIDQLRVWHAALTQEQVQARMNRTIDLSSTTADDLVASYRFDIGSGTTAYDVANRHDGTFQGDPQWADPSEASAGRKSAVLTDSNTPVTVGPSGSRVEAALSSGTGLANDATVYRWGTEGGSVVTDETFPNGVDDRSNVAWGVWPRGSAETELTLSYGDVSGLPSGELVRLLKRDRPGTAWTDASGASTVSHDTDADQFTISGASNAAQYAVTTISAVDLTLSADASSLELSQGEQTTVTLSLENTSGSTDASGAVVEVTVPSGLSVQGSSGDGSYSGGTWDVGAVGAGATATLDLTVQKDAAPPQTLSAQLGGGNPDDARTTVVVAPRAYGSAQALAFDGSGDYVAVGAGGDDLGLVNESFSVDVWFKPSTLPGSGDHALVGQDASSTNEALHLALEPGGEVVFGFFDNDLRTTGSPIQTGAWQHLTFVYDATKADGQDDRFLYLNGAQIAADESSADFQGTSDLRIGRWNGINEFDGQIDQVRVWQGALTQQQVQARMNRTIDLASDVGGELVTAYRFDTGSGTTAYDVASGHDGTLQGDPQWIDPSGASAGRESTVLTDSNTPVTVGPSGSRVEAALSSGTGLANDATVYRWGTEGGSVVTDETFPNGVDDRSNVAWGVWPRGSAEAGLTLSYGDVSGLPSGETAQLLRRDRPGAAWSDVSENANVDHDAGSTQFTVTGAQGPAQYAVTAVPSVDLQLVSDVSTPELSQGEQTTITFTLEHTSGSIDATGVVVDVTVPSGLSVQGSSVSTGSYASGTWDVGTLGPGATATLEFTVQKDAALPQSLAARLGALEQGDPNGAQAAGVVAPPPPYGSEQTLTFDGSSDYLATGAGGDDLGLATESFSVGAWVQVDDLSEDRAIAGMDGGAANETLHLAVQGDGTVKFGFYANDLETSAGVVSTGTWTHLTFVYDATKADGQPDRFVYKNGTRVASDEASADFQGTGELLIGRWGGGHIFSGQLDQVRVWQNALTQQAVQARMNRTVDLSSAVADDLVASYRMNTGSGTTAFDVIGGHHGTFQNAPQWTDPSGASVGRESAVLTDGTTPVTIGPSGSSVQAALNNGTGLVNDATVYRWGAQDGALITDDAFPSEIQDRSNVAWGVWPRAAAEATLTLNYGDVQGLTTDGSESVQLLRRHPADASWIAATDASGVSHAPDADQFTVSGVTSPGQYTVANGPPPVDLTLSASPSAVEVQPNGTATTDVTLTLDNTDGTDDASGVVVDVSVPSGLSVHNSSGDGSYSDGTWTVGTVAASGSAAITLSVSLSPSEAQTLSTQLNTFDQIDNDGASTSARVVPLPYGAGQALAFDGNDHVSTGAGGDDLGLANESFSIGAWVKVDDLSTNRTVAGMDASGTNEALHLVVKNDGGVKFGFFGNDLDTPSGGVVSTGTWTHLTFVYDAANSERFIYKNGRQVAHETGVSSDLQGTKELLIGRWNGGSEFNGQLDLVRVWQGALTQAQVQARMNRTIDLAHTTADALVASYRFDTGSGTTAVNATGGSNGTFQGDPQWTDPSTVPLGQQGEGLVDGTTPVTVGPSGSSVEASQADDSDPRTDATVYRWGTESGSKVADGTLSDGRSNVAWGLWPRGSTAADLTIAYGDVQSVSGNQTVYLLRRVRKGQPWLDVTGTDNVSHDPGANTFTVTGAANAAQYAVANEQPPTVDLELTASPREVQVSQGGSFTTTLSLDNLGTIEATGAEVTVDIPAGLTLDGSSGDGTLSDGTWSVGSIGAGATASLELTLTNNATTPPTLSGELAALDQTDANPDNDATSVSVRAYGSGTALTFDGSDDYVEVSTSDEIEEGPEMSFEAWVYLNDTSGEHVILEKYVKVDPFREGYLLSVEGGQLRFKVGGVSTDGVQPVWFQVEAKGGSVPTGEWTHVAATFRSGVLKAFVNGRQVAQNSNSVDEIYNADNDNTLSLGSRDSGSGEFFDGKIDQVRIWTTELSQEEIQARAHRTINVAAPIASDLGAGYRFDVEDSGVVYDVTGAFDGANRASGFVESGAAVGRRSTILTDATTPQTVGPSGSSVEASLTAGTGLTNDATVYRWGKEEGSLITGEEFSSDDFLDRSNVAWGIWPRGQSETDLTIRYGDVSGLITGDNTPLRLLRRGSPNGTWTDVTDLSNVSHDPSTDQFTVGGVTDGAQYAVANRRPAVDLTLTSGAAPMVEIAPNTETTITVTLDNTTSSTEATGMEVDVAIPDGLTVLSESPSVGSYSGGTWTVPTLPGGDAATLELTAQLDQAIPRTLTTQLSTLDQRDSDGASLDVTFSPLPLGSGSALALDGAQTSNADHVRVPDADALDLQPPFTAEAWIKWDGSEGFRVFLSKPIFVDVSSFSFVVSDGHLRAGAARNDDETLPANTWLHVVTTYDDNGNQTLYIDGQVVETASYHHANSFLDTDMPLLIGREFPPGNLDSRTFPGSIDQVRLWNTELTQEQVQARMHRTIDSGSSAAADLVAAYRFDAGSGSTAYDATGPHNGTLKRDPTWVDPSVVPLGQQSAYVAAGETQSTGPPDVQITATLGSGVSPIGLYSFGKPEASTVTDEEEDFGTTIVTERLPVVWGVEDHGSTTADLTLAYGGMLDDSDPATLRVLRRTAPGQPWTDVSDQFTHDAQTQTFSASGVSTFSQYALGRITTALQIDGTAGADGSDAGWRFIGVPTAASVNAGDLRLGGQAPLFDLPDGHMLHRWNDEQGSGTTGGYQPIESSSETLQPGRGVALFLFDQDPFPLDPSMTIDLAGDPAIRGGESVSVDGLAPSARWHFLANPYPTGYDLSSLTDLTANGFQNTVQRYDATTSSWVVEDQSSTELSQWQAFFVERTDPGGSAPGATSLTFDPAGRIATAPFVGSKAEEDSSAQQARLELALSVLNEEGDTLSYDAAAQVLFDERATDGWDAWDGSKLMPLSSQYALLAPVGLGRDSTTVTKAVESRPWPSARQKIPLRLLTEGGGGEHEATLSVRQWHLPEGWQAQVIDTEKGASRLLRPDAELSLSLPADSATGPPRYEVHVAPSGASLPAELSSFAASGTDAEAVTLTWKTAPEVSTSRFVIERRPGTSSGDAPTDGWTRVKALEGKGAAQNPKTYQYTDRNVPYAADTLTYRLRQVDTNGTTRLSEARTVERRAVQKVQLHGSFPNPAQSQATLRYALPQPTEVRLELYDVLGRRVMTIVRGEQNAGRKQVQLDVNRLASGTYFYRLEVGDTTKTRKLTIVR